MAERTVSVALQAKVTGFVSGMKTAKKAADDFGGGLLSSAHKNKASLDDLAQNAGILGAALTGVGVLAVKRFADFDKAMSSVKATGDDARGSIDKLRDAAIQAGADTAFSATEAANGIENLAKAGVSANDILGGGLKGALDLAAAGQISVADASETAASAMTQFNLTGADVPHIADLLAAGAGKAQGEVGDMAQALAQSGLVAAQFGLSIEDTTGTLAAFASAGLLGSDAGTSFKTMLLALANPAEETKETMQNLGIAAYDAQGNFVGVANLAQQLKDKLGPLSQAQRDAALAQIFGSDAIRAANVLYQQGGQGITDWIGKVDDSGFAAETAATKMDNLAGDIETFTGSLDSALTGIGEKANGPLRGLVQGATDAVNAFANLPGPVQGATLAIAGGGGLALLATAGMIKVVTAVSDTKDALENVGITGGKAARALKFAGVAAGFVVITQAADSLGDSMRGLDTDSGELARSFRDWNDSGKMTGELAKLVGDNFEGLGDAADKANRGGLMGFFDGVDNVATSLIGVSGVTDDARKRLELFDQTLVALDPKEAKQLFDEMTASLKAQGYSVAEINKLFPDYHDKLRTTAKEAAEAEKKTKTFGGTTEETKPKILDAAGALETMDARAKGLDDTLNVLNSTLSNLDAESAYEQSVDDLQQRFKDYREEVKKGDEATKGMKGAFDLGTQAGRDNAQALRDVWQRSSEFAVQTLETTGNQKAANGALAAGRQQLVDMATKFLGSKGAAEKYVDEVLGIPKDVTSQWQTPGLSDALARAHSLNREADNFDGRRVKATFTATYITNRVTNDGTEFQHGMPRRARGGPVQPGQMYLVGEEGPEIAMFGERGTILPAGATSRLLSGAVRAPDPVAATAAQPYERLAEATDQEWKTLQRDGWQGKAGEKLTGMLTPLAQVATGATGLGASMAKAKSAVDTLAKSLTAEDGSKGGGGYYDPVYQAAMAWAGKFGLTGSARTYFVKNFRESYREQGNKLPVGGKVFEDGSYRNGFAATGQQLDLGAYKRGGRPVMTPVADAAAAAAGGGSTVTNNFYPRSVDINEANLASFTHAARVRERVGRPR